jgi:hypothetical protein
MVTDKRGRRLWVVAVLSAMVAGFLASPANAAPGEDGGTNPSLREQLEAANRGFLDAQANLEASRKRQAELAQKLTDTQDKLAALNTSANELASAAYRNNGLRTASALLSSVSPDNLVDRATAVNTLAIRNDKQLREFGRLSRELIQAKSAVDAEVGIQEKQLAEMAKRKADAEKAVGGTRTTGYSGGSATAQPAPKVNGKWPAESCNQDDPTTGGCLTARTLHAYKQARAAGFTRYCACYRSGEDGGQHPRGRACDFAAAANGFGGVATGGDYTYGSNLAAFFVNNANNLAVLYVIWFRKIWQPSTGWRTYSGSGSPAATHENHVHLSVY